MEGASRVDNGVIFHKGVESKGGAHIVGLLWHAGLLGCIERIVMEFRVKFQVVLSCSAAVHSRDLRREVGFPFASLHGPGQFLLHNYFLRMKENFSIAKGEAANDEDTKPETSPAKVSQAGMKVPTLALT